MATLQEGASKGWTRGKRGGQGLQSSRGRIRLCPALTARAMSAELCHGWSGEKHLRGNFIQDREILGRGHFLEHNQLICKTSKIHQK